MGRPLVLSMLNILPLKVNIVGTKRNLILKIGDWFSREGQTGTRELDVAGHRVKLDLGHSNERLLYYAMPSVLRSYESSGLVAAMGRYLRPQSTFVDIGANLGIFSLLAKTRFDARRIPGAPLASMSMQPRTTSDDMPNSGTGPPLPTRGRCTTRSASSR